MSSRLKAGGSSKHRPGSVQKSISSFFIKPSQEKSGDKSVNQDVSVARSNSNVRDVPVAAVTPFHVNNDTLNNSSIIDTIDLTVTSPRPRKFQYKKPKASLASQLFDDGDDILSSVMEKIEGKREEKEKVKTPKPSKSSDSAWLEELFGSTPPQIKKAEPKLKKPEAIGRASLSPSPWDDDDDFQETPSSPAMKRKSLEFRGTPVKTNSRGTPVKNKSRETPVKNTPEPFGPSVEDLEAVFHEEMDISMEEEEMSLENRIRAKKNLSSQNKFAGYTPSQEISSLKGLLRSPPSTPPRPDLLETCPVLPKSDVKELKPTQTIPESQDIIDPSPVKPKPSRLSSIGRLRLSSKSKPNEESPSFKSTNLNPLSPADPEIDRLKPLIDKLHELFCSIRKNRSFHKAVTKINTADLMKHEEWRCELESGFAGMFLLWNVRSGLKLPDAWANKIEAVKICAKKILDRLAEYEKLENRPEPCRNLYVPDLEDEPDFPSLEDEDSPPFEPSERLLEPPGRSSSPILFRNSKLNSPLSIPETCEVSLKPKSFTFKKPVSKPVKPLVEEDDYEDPSDMLICDKPDKPSSKGFDFNAPGPSSSFSSNYTPTTFSGFKTPLRSDHATQFIEDFNTQKDISGFGKNDSWDEEENWGEEGEEGDIDYNRQLYTTQSSSSSTTRVPFNSKKQSGLEDINLDGKFIGEARNDGKDAFLSGENHSFSREVKNVLKEKFGIRSFRPNQLQAVNSTMLGKDTFVLMPTGGGKSLCYQLPAAVQGGITVVISPLVSLIHDQVTKLNGMNISADHLSGDDYNRHRNIYNMMRGSSPGPTLLYVTPEKVSSSTQLLDALMSVYNQGMLRRFVIDEAHCVSQWGHDFRPDYKKLSLLRQKFPQVPLMALTATATPRVRTDILFQLKMKDPKWFLSSFNRSNLKYEVMQKKGKSVTKDIIDVIKGNFSRQSGIVYCLSKKDCEDVARTLSQSGISAAPYHAGLNPELRSRTQDDWIQDKIRVVCATIAFGMGIDKPDVRFVLHQSLPKSIEGYYQESGRAGRDGEPSRCILFYCYGDMHRLRKLIDMGEGDPACKKIHYENLWQMVRYCENLSDCRRVLQLQYFGEVFDHTRCGEVTNMRCDNCTRNMLSTMEKVDITEIAKMLVIAVQRISQRSNYNQKNFTVNHFVDIWRGAKNQKVISSQWDTDPIYGKGSGYNALDANRILRLLILEGYLWESMVITRDKMASAYLSAGSKAADLLQGRCTVLHQMEGKRSAGSRAEEGTSSEQDPKLVELQEECFNELKHLVLETGKELYPSKQIKGVNEIIPLQALKQIAEMLPTSLEALKRLEYLTEYRVSLYGEVILNITREYNERRMEYLTSQVQANQLVRDEEDFTLGDENGEGWLSKGGKSKYFKGGRGGGYKKRGGGKRKSRSQGGTTPKRRSVEGGGWKGKSARGGTGGWTSSRGGGSSRGSSAPRGGGSSGSMGLPKRLGVNA